MMVVVHDLTLRVWIYEWCEKPIVQHIYAVSRKDASYGLTISLESFEHSRTMQNPIVVDAARPLGDDFDEL